jgi:hypothetical protein
MQSTFANATGPQSPAGPGATSTFANATGAQSPMAHVISQVGIAWSVLADPPLVTTDFTAGYDGVPAVAAYLGQELTPEQADDVQRGVEEIHADPELSGRIHRVVGRIDWSQIRDLSPKAVATAVAVWLFRYSDTNSGLVTNRLTAMILIVAIATFIVITQQKKDVWRRSHWP